MKRLMALLLVVALAGCSESPVATETDEPGFQNSKGGQLEATETTGILRGVVIDGSITPIEGATVTILGTGETTQADANGAFGFDELDPGTYFLSASKPGYNGTQTSTEVVAGVAEPPIVKILLEFSPGSAPYFAEFQWTGYFTCSTAAVQLCPAADLVLEIAGNPDVLNDDFLVTVPIEQPPTWINSELVWDSNQPLGQNLDFYLEWVSKEDSADWNTERSVEGASPLLLTVGEAEAIGYDYGNSNDMRHRVFPELSPENLVFVDQFFDIYTHIFYNYTPPEGWQFTVDPTVPSPPS